MWDGLIVLAPAAFVAGLMGGLHCAGMCGGLIGAVGLTPQGGTRWRIALAYNVGRMASYAMAGALAGGLGQAGLAVRGGPVAQTVAGMVAGAALLLLALYVAGFPSVVRQLEAAGAVLWRRIQPATRYVLPVTNARRAAGLGLLWGWLPCGMVYVLLLSALATANAASGALVMAAFGAGTLPNVLGLTWLAQRLGRMPPRGVARRLAAATIVAAGVYGLAMMHHAAAANDEELCRVPPAQQISGEKQGR